MIKLKNRLSLSKEQKTMMVEEIKKYFLDQRDVEIGDLGASLLLDFIAEKLAPAYYNLGVLDAKTLLLQKLEDLHGLEIWQ